MDILPESSEREPFNVTVRMYCHGLGDCFLLTFHKGARKSNMLIDCGVLQGTTIEPNPERKIVGEAISENEIMRIVAEDIKKKTQGHLNVVVATHEHHDHICGFKHAKDIFDEIQFDQVWLGWTEDPTNKLAMSLQKKQIERTANLWEALKKMRPLDRTGEETIDSFIKGFAGDAFSAKPRARAEAWRYITGDGVRKGNQPEYVYCYPGREPFKLKDFEEEVQIYVLGPPDKLEKLRDLNAPSVDQYRHAKGIMMDSVSSPEDNFFLAMADESVENGAGCPFRHDLGISEKEAEAQLDGEFFRDAYYGPRAGQWRTIDSDWMAITGEIALKMDSYTNNTSLVLAIELIKSQKVLLFVGDAQFGNWESWHDHEWKITGADQKEKVIKTQDLLNRTVLYKVGHHGSHNATLKEHGLEMMTNIDRLVALIPVDEALALSKKPHKWEMPFVPLFEDLKKKTNGRVIASDRDVPEGIDPKICIPDKENQFFERKLFVDYIITGDSA